jgi:predicted GNAT family acetyltransferase
VDVSVSDNESRHRYEAVVDGTVAGFIDYRVRPDGARDFLHTEVDKSFEGHGIGSKLARGALAAERERGGRIVATCPFIDTYLKRHPEYADLVAAPA